jgi:hypothetical protein
MQLLIYLYTILIYFNTGGRGNACIHGLVGHKMTTNILDSPNMSKSNVTILQQRFNIFNQSRVD